MTGLSLESTYNSLAAFIQNGGFFMGFILAVWATGIAISLERFSRLKSYHVDGPSLMNELQRYVLSNDIQGAIRVCSGSASMLPKVLKSALKRASKSPEQIQNAIDATALEVIPKVERRLPYLQLIANVSTLLGLLGTIQGLIESFSAVAAADPQQKSILLATGISKAMNTTFMGLLAAITIMMIHAFLSSKSEIIVNEIDEYSVKMMDMLSTKKDNET